MARALQSVDSALLVHCDIIFIATVRLFLRASASHVLTFFGNCMYMRATLMKTVELS